MADTLVVCLNSETVQWVIQWSAYSGNLTLCPLIVPCDSSILYLPCIRKLAGKLTGIQSNSAVDQTAKYSSAFSKVCGVQVYTVTPATLCHCAQQGTYSSPLRMPLHFSVCFCTYNTFTCSPNYAIQ